MERKVRLNHSLDIQRVRRYGKSVAHPLFVLIHLKDKDLDYARVGVIASKAVGGAVERNRSKRLLRSAAGEVLEHISSDQMVLLLARKPILECDSREVVEVLTSQLKKAGIYRETVENEE